MSEVFVATLQHDSTWRRVTSTQDNTTSATAGSVTLRRGSVSGVACVAVADGACDGASLRSLRPVVRHVATDRRFVRTVETVLKSPPVLHGVTDLPPCSTTALSWYRTTSAPTSLNSRMLTCVTGNHLSASARLLVECKTAISNSKIRDPDSRHDVWVSMSFQDRVHPLRYLGTLIFDCLTNKAVTLCKPILLSLKSLPCPLATKCICQLDETLTS